MEQSNTSLYSIEPNRSAKADECARAPRRIPIRRTQDKLSTLTAITHQFSRCWQPVLPQHRALHPGRRFRLLKKAAGDFLPTRHHSKVRSLSGHFLILHVVTNPHNALFSVPNTGKKLLSEQSPLLFRPTFCPWEFSAVQGQQVRKKKIARCVLLLSFAGTTACSTNTTSAKPNITVLQNVPRRRDVTRGWRRGVFGSPFIGKGKVEAYLLPRFHICLFIAEWLANTLNKPYCSCRGKSTRNWDILIKIGASFQLIKLIAQINRISP